MAQESTNPSTTTTQAGEDGSSKDDREVIVIERDHYPLTDLWADVYVVGPESKQLQPLFARAKCRRAESPDKADLVVFSGSASDVSPALYGEEAHFTVYSDPFVDTANIQTYLECAYLGIPMIGICGGAQFLHVANHGKLFQHIDHHNQPHSMMVRKGQFYIDKVSSCHHQACIPNESGGMEVLAEAYESTKKWVNPTICRTGLFDDHDYEVEAFWYPETACLGFQGHPEYHGFDEYSSWFTQCIYDYILTNPDIELVGSESNKVQRLKRDIVEQRKYRVPDSFFQFLKKTD